MSKTSKKPSTLVSEKGSIIIINFQFSIFNFQLSTYTSSLPAASLQSNNNKAIK